MAVSATDQSARDIINSHLSQYGLQSLGGWAWLTYIANGGGQTGMDAIDANMPDQPAFKARFPAYDTLRKQGRAMSVNDMLNYENSARQVMHQAGLPTGFYDSPDDFAKFMVAGVSPSELQQRVNIAQSEVLTGPADVRQQLHNYYGLTTGQLTAHALDPNVSMPLLQQQFTSAQIGAESVRTGFGQVDRGTATHLTQLGVTDAQAQQGFNQLAMNAGLFEQQVQGESAIGRGTQISAQFEQNAQAQLAFARRKAERLAAFNAGAGFTNQQGGVSGLAPAQHGV